MVDPLGGIFKKILNITRHNTNSMDLKISLAIMSLAVVSIALAPSLINRPVEAASHWCEHQGHSVGSSWVRGCKNGWWDCDHNQHFNPESGSYAKGYNAGWKKGGCKLTQQQM